MKFKSLKLVPLLICCGVVGLVCLLQWIASRTEGFGGFERLEWATFDWRMRLAAEHASRRHATNLGFVFIGDESAQALLKGALDYRVGLLWPRFVYGHLVNELTAQGATVVGFDVLFPDLRPDHPPAHLADGTEISSDHYFAQELARAGNVVLAADEGAVPDPLFRTNAWATGDVSAIRDPDGILRRARAFRDYYIWNPLLAGAARQLGWDLRRTVVETNRLIFYTPKGEHKIIPMDAERRFNQITLFEELTGQKVSARISPMMKAFTKVRGWEMGLVLAARELGLDLDHPQIDLEQGRIILHGSNGLQRVIPVDAEGRFYINWEIRPDDPVLVAQSIESLLMQERDRRLGSNSAVETRFKDKIVVVGSAASGNNLSDVGATPLDRQTLLTSRYWNNANSMLTGRFIRQSSFPLGLLLILVAGAFAGHVSWNWRPSAAVIAMLICGAGYVAVAVSLFIARRYWLPLVFPLFALYLTHFSLVSYRALFEQHERRRIKDVFAKIVSPNVVNELLKAEKLDFAGARRQVTVFFADVRGFTEMTDDSHASAEQYVREHGLAGREAEAFLDEQSQEVLRTVNLYLSVIADIVKKHEGTLDKYIGDCVMAFWGSPTPNDKHALACVRAAIESQRAIHSLNQERQTENVRREEENTRRAREGAPPLPMLRLLSLGTGVNTGIVTVGLMGSSAHIRNYTVFGRDVNLASRLESVSGRGRIIVGEATYLELRKDDPALAASCIELKPAMMKGFRSAVKTFEVPWKKSEPGPAPASAPGQPQVAS